MSPRSLALFSRSSNSKPDALICVGNSSTVPEGLSLPPGIEFHQFEWCGSSGDEMIEVTQLLKAMDQGDPHAAAQLLPLVYDELRRLAATRLAVEPAGNTLQPTALVHEAYLRLVRTPGGDQWDHRGHFFAAAAEAMRRILIDSARRKAATRHGGTLQRHSLELDATPIPEPDEELLALDEALNRLEAEDPLKANLVKLRYFAGLSLAEAATILDLSERTAGRHWAYARAWLRRAIEGPSENE